KAIIESTLHHSVDEKSYVDQNKKVDTTYAKTNQEIYPVWENNLVKNKTKQTKNNENAILLAAAFSAGGSLPASSNGNEMADLNKNSIVTVATNYTTVMAPIDFSQITYLTPVSFGFVIQKPIDKRLKLESGLVYTYLSTNFRNGGMQQSTADLHLHYIGVPLNLIALIMDNSKWEFYLSGGGMLEKGIRSIYIQNQNFGNQTITTTASTNIAGFQWSINGAIGTTYKFQKHMGIYFEPKISYFFNDNQPISGRTDQPVSVGLTAGLRYQF
ncbi:MAG: outer membrane beta-barrel protein, partial [Paludibacter sp.]